MVRTQIQLPADKHRRLKQLAAERGVSMAELVRNGIDLLLGGQEEEKRREARLKALTFAGMFSGDRTDVAERHDDYLADAYEEKE